MSSLDDARPGDGEPQAAWSGPGDPPANRPRSLDWDTLTSDEAETAWLELHGFVSWLRRDFRLTDRFIPPRWYRRPDIVWVLTALHTAKNAAWSRDTAPEAQLAWLRELRQACQWLAEMAADTEDSSDPAAAPVENRDADFVCFVVDDVSRRRAAEVLRAARPQGHHGRAGTGTPGLRGLPGAR